MAPPVAAAAPRGPRSSLQEQLDRHHTTSFLQPLLSPLSRSPRTSLDLTPAPESTAAAAAAVAQPVLSRSLLSRSGSRQFARQIAKQGSRLGRSGSRRSSTDGSGDLLGGEGGAGGMLRMPMLSRIASRGRERYGPDGGSDDEGADASGDIESGQVCRLAVGFNKHVSMFAEHWYVLESCCVRSVATCSGLNPLYILPALPLDLSVPPCLQPVLQAYPTHLTSLPVFCPQHACPHPFGVGILPLYNV
jgi:hypothetical protein